MAGGVTHVEMQLMAAMQKNLSCIPYDTMKDFWPYVRNWSIWGGWIFPEIGRVYWGKQKGMRMKLLKRSQTAIFAYVNAGMCRLRSRAGVLCVSASVDKAQTIDGRGCKVLSHTKY